MALYNLAEIKEKTTAIEYNSGSTLTTITGNCKVTSKLESTGALLSEDDVTGFGTHSI